MSEASSNLARFDGIRYGFRVDETGEWNEIFSKDRQIGFEEEIKRRIILGTYALSRGYYDMYYLKALKVRTLIKKDFESAFNNYDLLVGPTMPFPPFKIGEKVENPMAMYMADIDTVPINLAGIPAISIPCGFTNGLPIGAQIMGNFFQEEKILKVAYAYEKSTKNIKTVPRING